MLNAQEKLLKITSALDIATVRTAYITRSRIESGRIADTRQWMLDNGFELLDIPTDRLLTEDGREVLRAHGKAWALKPEIHAQRLAEAVEQAKQRDTAIAAHHAQQSTQATPPTTCTSLIDGQLCGGTLAAATVCPRCALGKSGVAATLTCDVCGHVTAVMREAK